MLETVLDVRDIGKAQHRPVDVGPHDDIREIRPGVVLAPDVNENLLAVGLYAPAGKVEAAAPHRRGHLVERQTVGAQGVFRYFDRDLVLPDAGNADEGDRRQRGEVVLDPVRDLLEGSFGSVAENRDLHDAAFRGQRHNLRLLGIDGEARDPVDGGLDLIQRLRLVRAQRQFGEHDADVLRGGARDAVDALDARDPLLDPPHDRLLDFVGRRAGVLDLDLDCVEGDLREGLLRQTDEAHEPCQDDQHHEQVRRDAVLGHPCDRAPHEPSSSCAPPFPPGCHGSALSSN